jgi:tetratricopeptide (TPR) repeat protein
VARLKKKLLIGILAVLVLFTYITPLSARIDSIEEYVKTILDTYTLWLVHLGIDNLEVASGELEQAISSYPDGAHQHLLLATSYLGQGKAKDAISAYQKVVDMGPEYYWVKALIGEVYLKQEDYDQAEELFLEVIAEDENSALALKGLGLCSQHRQEDETAMEYYERSLEIAPNAPEVYLELALLKIKANEQEEALTILETGRLFNLDDPRIHYYLGMLYEEKGDLEAASHEYYRAVQLDPQNDPAAKRLENMPN